MNLHLAALPDDHVELAKWLEPKVAGLDLPELAAELSTMFPSTAAAPELDAILGRYDRAVLNDGLVALPENRLRMFLEHPNRLLDLQLFVLGEDSGYWRRIGDATALGARAAKGKERICPADDSTDKAPAVVSMRRPTKTYLWATASSMATAAAVLLAVWFAKPFPGQPIAGQPIASAGGWGWNQTDILKKATTPAEHLEQLASGADQWFNKKPATAPELGARIAEMRRGCSQLILGEHPQLNKEQRDWLVGKCKAWAEKLDQQLAALERGTSIEDVRKNADEIVRNLSKALREKAKEAV